MSFNREKEFVDPPKPLSSDEIMKKFVKLKTNLKRNLERKKKRKKEKVNAKEKGNKKRKGRGKGKRKGKQEGVWKSKGIKVGGIRIDKASTNVKEMERKVWNKKSIFFPIGLLDTFIVVA